jgi:flagellar basal body rod protein FlgF
MTMQSNFRQQFNTIAKQAVPMHGSWLAINSLSLDRTPEGYISQGSLEGGGYA